MTLPARSDAMYEVPLFRLHELRDAEAERDRLRDAIEEYRLWKPGEKGHAEAHRKLMEALR